MSGPEWHQGLTATRLFQGVALGAQDREKEGVLRGLGGGWDGARREGGDRSSQSELPRGGTTREPRGSMLSPS